MVASKIDFLQAQRCPGHLRIPVPWDAAETLCGRLRLSGIAATALYEAASHCAEIRLPEQVDLGAINEFMNQPKS